ncbi:unnamed protein product (macronuclear) [Paramecium tetraurelia]|uniref:Uncharacterized protein n=1 Tax=Paramecium tetraurelia TaxID=5888 RepID=A0DEL2_PARTE|nr:uncharacterized protein GSPATT00016305001 [Paramecium tetraurelia]CAK81479.1 unnamed protein product [Paramecium tetraurelia]|eukprot:XP_001448876.1 hypothetical protein (macronuclear) [Paramecium tetraurelia strain d4-2]
MEIIKIGSIVSISHLQDDDALIGGDGFIKNAVILKGMSPQNKLDTKDFNISYFSQMNMPNCLFVICPRTSNGKKVEVAKLFPQRKKKPFGSISDDVTDQKSEVTPVKSQIKSATHSVQSLLSEKQVRDNQMNLFNEFKFNVDGFEKEKGNYVKYEEPIQLLHLASSKWLCSLSDEAKFENQNFKLALSDYTSDETLFKIVATYKYQKEGDQIVYSQEIVRIMRMIPFLGKPTFLHCSGEIPQKAIKEYKDSSEVKIQKREINASLEESTSWKINLFSEELPIDGDLVWIHHSETCSQLAVDYERDLNKAKLSVFQTDLSELSFDNYSGNAYSLWIIEDEDYKKGGPYLYSNNYRLKHFHTGLYLACVRVIPKEQEDIKIDPYGKKKVIIPKSKKVPATFALQVRPNKDALFKFEPLKSVEKNEIQSDFIQIKSVTQGKYLDVISKYHQDGSTFKPIILNQKNEHAVFKIFRANKQETQEVLFLDSCTKQLRKYQFYINLPFKFEQNQVFQQLSDDVDLLKIKTKKLATTQRCIQNLDDFLRQKIYNSSPSQKYGFISSKRQKLLKDQHFFDVLLQILTATVTKQELETWANKKGALKAMEQPSMTEKNQRKQLQSISEKEKLELSNSKIEVCNLIFMLLQTSVINNTSNQLYLFERLPDYQHYCKYLPQTINFLIEMVKCNEKILINLCNNLKIEFDYIKKQEIEDDLKNKVKVLINFYEKDVGIQQEVSIPVKVHDRIITRPINIIQYFFNLMIDDTAKNNEHYLRFLRHLCRYKNNAISINQENLFKLYKKYSKQTKLLHIETNNGCIIDKEISFQYELLQFFSEVSYGRNYLWQAELSPLFEKEILINQIWNPSQVEGNQIDDKLRSFWCRLSRTLYVDQQPFQYLIVPNYCRLYSPYQDQLKNRNDEEIEKQFKLKKMFKYIKTKRSEVYEAIANRASSDLLNDELVYNAADQILTMLQLDIMPSKYYNKIIKYMSEMFIYDRKNLDYLNAAVKSYQQTVNERKGKKSIVINQFGNVFNGMKDLIQLNQEDKEEVGEEEEEEEINLYDQPKLFLNPIMKGFMSMSNQLEGMITLPKSQQEIEFKLKVCSILDHFLDRRQNFLISNILLFFLKYQYTNDDLSDEDDDQTIKAAPKIFNNNYKTLIPTIARTGIDEIDEPEDTTQDFLQMAVKKPQTFTNYFQQYSIKSEEEFQELDYYLSQAQKFNNNERLSEDQLKEKQVASLLPYLISTYFLVKDQVLEERCLNVIMRVFNQREELRENMKKLQILFDDDNIKIYEFVEHRQRDLRVMVEKTEIWLTQFKAGYDVEELDKCTQNIRQLTLCMRQGVQVNDQELVVEVVNKEIYDSEKQSVMTYLNIHEIIVNLIQNGMAHFIQVLNDEFINIERKEQLLQLFSIAFKFLICYCTNNKGNQLILYQYLEIYLQYIQYDIGQCKLLIEIFKDNPRLLNTGVKSLVSRLTEIIEREGRQVKFIEIFINLISIGGQYLLENQILILNTFLPMRELKETEQRLLYAEGSQQKDLRFYFEDQFLDSEENLLHQLEAIDWKDCYRDEPFLYHSKILDLLLQTSLIDNTVREYNPSLMPTDSFNISVFKLKKLIKPSYLLEILRLDDDMVSIKQRLTRMPTQFIKAQANQQQEELFNKRKGYTSLKPIVCEFLRLVHIVSEKNNAQEGLLSQSSRQFIHFVEFESKKLEVVAAGTDYQNCYIDYIIGQVIPLILCYHQRVLSVQQEDVKTALIEFSSQFAQALCSTFYSRLTKYEELEIISKLREYYQNEYYEPAFRQEGEQSILHLYHVQFQLEDGDDLSKPIQEQMVQSIPKKSQTKSKNLLSQFASLNLSLVNNKTSKHKRGELTPIKLQEQWKKFVEEMFRSQKLEEEIDIEKQALADAIIGIEKLIKETCEIKPSLESILKKFITFLQTAVLQQDNKGTIVILLKIMSKIIEKQDSDEKKEYYQKLFDNLGATRMVLNVITDYSKLLSNEMLFYLISFINVLLRNGNTQVQNTIYTFCQTQQKSEVMFSTFAKYLEIAATSGRDMNEDQEEAEIQKKIVNCILKFFQNCTEGHYQNMQNYIRYQHNSRASKDLINLVADLFKNYDRTKQNFSNLMCCLDTLNELVQGPCSENQIAVADSKFFDVVQEMFPLRKNVAVQQKAIKVAATKKMSVLPSSSASNLLSRGMKAQLQNKILILVLSLLENREIRGKNSIIKRIMRVLPMNVLERHLSKIYKKWFNKYTGDYNMQAFELLKIDPMDLDEESQEFKDCEIIIQNGFYIMFLICYYMESDEEIDSVFMGYNKQYLKSQIQQNSLFDPNSTLGQLFALGMEVYEMSLLKTQQMFNELNKARKDDPEFILEQQKRKQEEKKKRLKKAFMFFRARTAHIEVVRDDQIELVFFPLLPFSKLNKDEKQSFQQTVDRSSAKSKVQDLMEKSPELIQIMRHEEEMNRFYKQYKLIGFFANYIQLWKDLAFYLTLIINTMIIASFSHQSDPDRPKEDVSNEALNEYIFFRKDEWTQAQTKELISALGYAMMVCSLFVVLFVLARIAPLIIKKALQRKPLIEGQGMIKLLLNWLAKFFFVLFYCLQDFQLVYYLGYGALSVIGTLVHPFFFCFHLTVILIRYPTLSNVVRAVTMPWQQLVLTLLLIIIITYIFTLIAFYALQEPFGLDCKEVSICFLQIFDKNFKTPGGIGGDITNNNPSPTYEIFRYLYDQINNLLLVIIMVSIASGIIIDTFGQLREDENKMNSDIKDKCFICGQENIIFERSSDGSSGGFKNHIRQNHYMWNYLYYIAYLQWKDSQDYSGIESYVDKKIKDTDLSWIPFGRARELDKGEDEQEKQIKQMEQSSSNIASLLTHTNDIIQALKEKKEKRKQHFTQQNQTTQQKEQIVSQSSIALL